MRSDVSKVQELDGKNLDNQVATTAKRKQPIWNGKELRKRRKRLGYTQETFIRELGIKSRQTLITWEKSEAELPRMVQLAVIALEKLPECQKVAGQKPTAHQRKAFNKMIAKTVEGEVPD